MTYTTKNGTRKNTYLLSNKRQREMTEKGWRVKVAESYQETEQEMYDRLSRYYEDVRIYEASTRIRGLHSIFAMCR